MINCILCLGGTRENKLVKLSEYVSATLTLEEAIRQQIPYCDTFLSNPSSNRITCTTCFRTFKSFYELLAKINQNQTFSLQTPIKSEAEDEHENLSFNDPQIEYKELEQIKIEPEFFGEPARAKTKQDDDFEWEMDDSEFWLEDEQEKLDTDYDEGTEKAKKTKNYVRYLKRSQVTPEMLKLGTDFVTIDGIEYKIPKKSNKKLKNSSKTEQQAPKTKNTPEGDERVRQFMEIKCEYCGADFPTFFKLGKHFRRFHEGSKVFLRCCGRKFYRRLTLLDHLDSHDASVIHECSECHKRYKTDKILKVHVDKIHKNIYQEVICNICGRTLKSQGALKKHLLVHEEDIRQFECYICKKSKYKNLKLLQVHFSVYHNPNKPSRSVCHICSAVVRAGHLKNHMTQRHSDVEIEKVQCEICDHWIMKTRMHIHKRKHAMGGVTCKICGKYLKSYGSLYSHMKILHENCKNFKCNYCDKAFYKETKLNEHVAVRHTREFLFKCRVPGCGREFRAEGNWKMHERKAHPDEYEKTLAPYYKRAPQEQVEEENEEGTALPPFSYF
ncbi:unnamed protein product [Chironomus riparius]|uniref:C2H2-type domain-containing protein n=1 Tax=Chironomus riparius TaxID=315576 RepID=A0A9N9S8E3_9DIPT|nr:unnamed protein product [Chironomus riparius]